MLIKLLILLFLLPSYAVRSLLWLTRLQQKEYRWDRFWHFITQGQSRQDLLKIIPQKKDFTRTGLTRPKFTPRLIVVTLILELSILLVLIYSWQLSWWLWLVICSAIILFLPLLILLASIPTALVFEWQVKRYVSQAQQKINQAKPQVIGITGSYGKTSTKILLQHLLQQKFSVFATQKSFNTRYSLARDIAQNYQGQEIAIIEYAAYKPGEISWLAKKIKPSWAVITGLAPQHLAIFGSVENIIKAKAELIQALPENGLVFLNAEDEGTLKILQQAKNSESLTDKQIIAYSGKNAQIKLTTPGLDENGRLGFTYQNHKVQTQLVGYRSLSIVQAGIAIAKQLSMPDKEIVSQLESFTPPSYFLSFKQAEQGFWILDDGRTTNPTAFADVIELAKTITTLKKLRRCYLITSGIIDLGDQSEEIHQQLANNARPVFEKVVYTGLPGKKQFSVIFKSDLIEQEAEIKQLLNNLTQDDLLVIEGWIPLWLKNYLVTER
jgi:UDP-N-acetylmuramoyl-tripeptide--D-alanyl-D-alanine ligase